MIVCLNGKFIRDKDAKISVFDHGFLYGDGVFDTIAAVNGQIFWLKDHIDRLLSGCRKIHLKIPWSKRELLKLTEKTFRKNKQKNGRIRIAISRGENGIPIYSSDNCKPNLVIFSSPLKFLDKKIYKKGITLKTTKDLRFLPQVKNLNFLPSVMAFLDAKESGYDDSLFVKKDRTVLEGTTFNIFAVKGKKNKTPAREILLGITAKKVTQLAKGLGFSVLEGKLTLKELKKADEIFITGTTKKIVPVIQIGKRKIGDGKAGNATKKLMEEFSKLYF